MDQELWDNTDLYIEKMLLPKDPLLEGALKASDEAGLAQINVAPNQGKFLQFLARIQKAERILEIGTLGGYSTIWMARALPPGGKLVSLEIDPKNAEVARANIAQAGLSKIAEVRVGPAADSLARMAAEKAAPFDMVFIDADKEGTAPYLEASLKLSRAGTLIIVDNAVRKGAISDPADQDSRVLGMKRAYEFIAREPRLTATALQTVGVKGHDGFILALVTG